ATSGSRMPRSSRTLRACLLVGCGIARSYVDSAAAGVATTGAGHVRCWHYEGLQYEQLTTGKPVNCAYATAFANESWFLYAPWPYLCSPPRFRTCPQSSRCMVTCGLCVFS